MAVLSADSAAISAHRGDGKIRDLKCGVADIFYKNALVFWASGGGITPVPAAGLEFAGIVAEASNGATTSGTTRVKVYTGGEHLILYNGTPAVGDEGVTLAVDVSAASDNPTDLILYSAGGTGDFSIGMITEFVSAGAGAWVNIDRPIAGTVHA